MITLKKTKTLLLGLAMALVALGVLETLPGVERLAVTAGLEIISGNNRASIFGPMLEPAFLAGTNTKLFGQEINDRAANSEPTEEPDIAGIRIKGSGTQVAF